MRNHDYWVYILTNKHCTTLYIGITNNLGCRAGEHSLGWGSAFARKYHAHKLVYSEGYADPRSAIEREKQLKKWSRPKKVALIAALNRHWDDLAPAVLGETLEMSRLRWT